jgi:hypothetical protein
LATATVVVPVTVVCTTLLEAAVAELVWTLSPPPKICAEFEMLLVPTAVDVPMVTGTVIALPLTPAAIAVEDVQLRLLAPIAPVHVQPVPVGTALSVKPVGSVSVTVIVAVVAAVPLLLGVIAYCAPL